MALIKKIITISFDENDTVQAKDNLKATFESQGYTLVHEVTDQKTKRPKEWLLVGDVQFGTFETAKPQNFGVGQPPKNNVMEFDPSGGMK